LKLNAQLKDKINEVNSSISDLSNNIDKVNSPEILTSKLQAQPYGSVRERGVLINDSGCSVYSHHNKLESASITFNQLVQLPDPVREGSARC
jgi:hypothetical protein